MLVTCKVVYYLLLCVVTEDLQQKPKHRAFYLRVLRQSRSAWITLIIESLIFQPELDFLLKQVWADNADYCSIQYAGTGALKTDFTRTGKRTKFGMLKDGYNSAIRYYKNNFTDGFRQVQMVILCIIHYLRLYYLVV